LKKQEVGCDTEGAQPEKKNWKKKNGGNPKFAEIIQGGAGKKLGLPKKKNRGTAGGVTAF